MDKKIGFYGGKFLPLHNGHVYSILHASRLCDELHVFLFYNTYNEEEKIKSSVFTQKFLIPKIRQLALEVEFKSYNNIKTHFIDSSKCFNTQQYDDKNIRWDYESKEVINIVGCEPNIVFSSEVSYEEYFKKSYPNAEIVLIDKDRSLFHISGTEIRKKGEIACWDFLPQSYRILCAKSIVFFGDKKMKQHIIYDLQKLYQTTCLDMINVTLENIKSELLKTRYNANKIFFINANEDNADSFKDFYNEQDICLYIGNCENLILEKLKNIKYKILLYDNINCFVKCLEIINSFL